MKKEPTKTGIYKCHYCNEVKVITVKISKPLPKEPKCKCGMYLTLS